MARERGGAGAQLERGLRPSAAAMFREPFFATCLLGQPGGSSGLVVCCSLRAVGGSSAWFRYGIGPRQRPISPRRSALPGGRCFERLPAWGKRGQLGPISNCFEFVQSLACAGPGLLACLPASMPRCGDARPGLHPLLCRRPLTPIKEERFDSPYRLRDGRPLSTRVFRRGKMM